LKFLRRGCRNNGRNFKSTTLRAAGLHEHAGSVHDLIPRMREGIMNESAWRTAVLLTSVSLGMLGITAGIAGANDDRHSYALRRRH
jgi:hypothetical protein